MARRAAAPAATSSRSCSPDFQRTRRLAGACPATAPTRVAPPVGVEGSVLQWAGLSDTPLQIHAGLAVVPLGPQELAGADLARGEVRWRVSTAGLPGMKSSRLHGHMTITDDGVLLCGMKTHLVAFDAASGEVRWRLPVHGAFARPIVVDGRCVTNAQEQVLALDATSGKKLWSATMPGAAGELCAAEGRVYAGYFVRGSDPPFRGGVVCLDLLDGRVLWQQEGLALDDAPVVDGGVVYLSRSQGLTAWDAATGAHLWNADVNTQAGGPSSPPAVGSGVGACREGTFGNLRAFDLARGAPTWVFDEPRGGGVFGWAGPRVWGEAVLLFDAQARLHAIGLADGRAWWVVERPGGGDYSAWTEGQSWSNAVPPEADASGRLWLAGARGWVALEW